MNRFQIRMPVKLSLEDIFLEMAAKAKRQTEDLMDQEVTESRFFHQLRESVSPYVRKFDLCNIISECSDEVEGAPWLDQNDKVYHLILPQGLDAFFDDLAFEAIDTFKPQYKPDVLRQVFAKLRTAFRQTLAKYIYFNPVCGVHPICKESQEVSPWAEKTVSQAS